MDSRPFVVFSDRPSTYTPRRCNVRVSSRPSARLPAADWFRSSSSCWSDRRGPRRTPDGCRRAGDAAATPAAHAWPGNSPRLTPFTRARWRKACRTAARSPLPPLRSPEAPGKHRPRSTKDRRNGVTTCSFSVSVSTKPRNRLSVMDAQCRLGERRSRGPVEFAEFRRRIDTATPTGRSPRESPRRPPRRCGTRSHTARASTTGH